MAVATVAGGVETEKLGSKQTGFELLRYSDRKDGSKFSPPIVAVTTSTRGLLMRKVENGGFGRDELWTDTAA